ncbi:MAG: DUF2795 domain-containing protein [Actinobacteria bacterium]|nr:MAG: DUF2795 domain-containing protein [Actinomycetota bacterium]
MAVGVALIQKSLKGAKYPTSADNLIDIAQNNNAPGEVLDVLNQIPKQDYNSPAQVMKAVGQVI